MRKRPCGLVTDLDIIEQLQSRMETQINLFNSLPTSDIKRLWSILSKIETLFATITRYQDISDDNYKNSVQEIKDMRSRLENLSNEQDK
jgi:hypothetical protein